jgi:hypothetical protein
MSKDALERIARVLEIDRREREERAASATKDGERVRAEVAKWIDDRERRLEIERATVGAS